MPAALQHVQNQHELKPKLQIAMGKPSSGSAAAGVNPTLGLGLRVARGKATKEARSMQP